MDITRAGDAIVTGEPVTYPAEGTPLFHVLGPDTLWLNGDSRARARLHQIARGSSLPYWAAEVIIVPLAALESAGVDFRSIIPVDVHGERHEYTKRISDTAPEDMRDMPTESSPMMVKIGSETVRRLAHIYTRWGGEALLSTDRLAWKVEGVVRRDTQWQLVLRINGQYHWHDVRHWLGDSVFTAERNGRREHFVSSFDHQESPPLYFLSQLPGPAASVDEAIEMLAPLSVKTARDMGREVVRQGDMFAVPMDVSTRELIKSGAEVKRRRVEKPLTARGRWRKARGFRLDAQSFEDRRVDATPLFGTAHTATEVATMPDGTQYARGFLYHDPGVIGQRRRPDHRRRKLGKQWHVVARNTVPVN